VLGEKPERKRQLVRPKRGWEDNIKMDLKEMGYQSVHWIHMTENRFQWRVPVNTVMNLLVSIKGGNFLTN